MKMLIKRCQGMYREIQRLTWDGRGVQEVTWAYSGTQGMCTVAERGLHAVEWLCTRVYRSAQGITG